MSKFNISEADKYLCCICSTEIDHANYAIRDVTPGETYFKWLWRHVVALFTFRFGVKYATILPVCDNCAKVRQSYNIAEKMNRTTF